MTYQPKRYQLPLCHPHELIHGLERMLFRLPLPLSARGWIVTRVMEFIR